MSRPANVHATPLYLSETDIAVWVLGDDAKRWPDIAAILEREGLPRIDPLTGRRFRPAVEAFLLRRHGVTQGFIPAQADGVENFPVAS
jgi:hypothetical protein